MENTNRYRPRTKDIEGMIRELAPSIKKTKDDIRVAYNLSDQQFSIAYENIELLLDCMCDRTGTPPSNHIAVAGQWCYITDLYMNSLANEFDKLMDQSLVEGATEEELVFKVAYLEKQQAYSMVDNLIKSYGSPMKRIKDGSGQTNGPGKGLQDTKPH